MVFAYTSKASMGIDRLGQLALSPCVPMEIVCNLGLCASSTLTPCCCIKTVIDKLIFYLFMYAIAHFSPDSTKLLTTDQYAEIRVYGGPLWDKMECSIPHPHRAFRHLTPIKVKMKLILISILLCSIF